MGQKNNPIQGHFRYERKFFTAYFQKAALEAVIKLHPAAFSEIYHEREINNIYLDSFDMKNYFDNMSGAERRVKVRVRWYGGEFGAIDNPVLELKVKEGLLCNKISFPLRGFALDRDFSIKTLRDVFSVSDIPGMLKIDLECLELSLLNRYRRKYYLSADKKFRLTLDTGLEFCEISGFKNSFLNRSVDHLGNIVELKYAKEDNDSVHRVASVFPFRMTRSSKYVIGLERLNLTKAYSHA